MSCENCGSQRVFEFQILPQTISFLEPDSNEITSSDKSIDFGTIVVYTCPKSCEPNVQGSYLTEYFVVHEEA